MEVNPPLALYVCVGVITATFCLVKSLRAIETYGLLFGLNNDKRRTAVYSGIAVSALQSGICWPLYLIALLIAEWSASNGDNEK